VQFAAGWSGCARGSPQHRLRGGVELNGRRGDLVSAPGSLDNCSLAQSSCSPISSCRSVILLPRLLMDCLFFLCSVSFFRRSFGVVPNVMGSIVSIVMTFVRRLARGVWNSVALGAALGGERGLAKVGINSSDEANSRSATRPVFIAESSSRCQSLIHSQ